VSEPVNVFEVDVEYRDDRPEGYRRGAAGLRRLVGGELLGATVYELPPGQSVCPYHYEYANEEWLLVLDGRPTLRAPDGERELGPTDVVCFPEGPEGAHKVTNERDETARIVMLSTQRRPAVGVYPDSDKIAVWGVNPGDNLIAPRSANVDYWTGEL
jgi:uncharacterized cupin superfamily protein